MKKLLSIAASGFLFLLVSCSTKKEPGMTATAQKNLDAMHGIINCFDKKDFSKLGDYVADSCIDHYFDTEIKGLANMKKEYEKWIKMSDNSKIRIITEMANDEYAITWIRFEETMKVDAMNMKAGQVFDKTDIEIARFRDGKAVDHWTFVDPAQMMKMMPQEKSTTGQSK